MSIDPTKSMRQLPPADSQERIKPRKQTPPSEPNPRFVPPHPLRRPSMDEAAIKQAVHNVWPNVHFGD